MRLADRFRQAFPPLWPTLALALAWALLMAASAMIWLYFHGWRTPVSISPVIATILVGSMISWPLSRFVVKFLVPDPSGTRRIAADILVHGAGTVLTSATVFAFVFRLYFAQWHGEILSKLWIFSFVFTIAAAFYQFLVLGARMMVPGLGLALVLYIFWIMRNRR